MKKLVKYGVLPACLLMLVACSSKPVVEKPQTKEDKVEQSSESKEEKTKKQIEKDGDIILRAIFTDHSSGFTTLMGTSVDKWKNQNIYQQKTTHLNSQLKHSLQKKSWNCLTKLVSKC